MDMIRGDGYRPDDALVVMIPLDNRRHKTSQPQTIAAHNDGAQLARLVQVHGAEFLAVERAQLEDMPHLDAAGRGEDAAAPGAPVSRPGGGDIRHDIRLEIPRVVDIFNVRIRLIAAGNEIGSRGHGVVSDYFKALQADRRGGAGDQTGLDDLRLGGHAQLGGFEQIIEFDFIYFQVAANHHEDHLPVGDIEDSFQCMAVRYFQETSHFFNRSHAGSGHFLHGQRLPVFDFFFDADGLFRVGGVVALRAVYDFVLAAFGNGHELARVLPSDGAAIGVHQHDFQATAVINFLVSPDHFVIAGIESGIIDIKAV